MSQDKCLNCGFELPDSPRERRYMAGIGSLLNPETEALAAANERIKELEGTIGLERIDAHELRVRIAELEKVNSDIIDINDAHNKRIAELEAENQRMRDTILYAKGRMKAYGIVDARIDLPGGGDEPAGL